MLIIVNAEQQVYLQRRPAGGIWGGLWGFPEIAAPPGTAEFEAGMADTLGMALDILEELPLRRHTFSHFHLDIVPLVCRLDPAQGNLVRDEASLWFRQQQGEKVGLAAPVNRLIQEIGF
jgi:A/G-specific adenine glycosylase